MTARLPRVDVIIPTHNRWPHVRDAIESVLGQTYQNVGCVIIDDASTDGSSEYIQNEFGDRVTLLVNKTNREKSFNRNRGVLESSAEFICFLDSDDVLLPESVEKRIALFLEDPQFDGVAFGYTRAEGESLEVSAAQRSTVLDLPTYLSNKNDLRTNSYLLRRNTMLSRGMYNESLTNREDIELFIRLLSALEFRSCQSVVSFFRKSAPVRARDNWAKIVEQGLTLTDTIGQNTALAAELGDYFKILRSDEYEELLRALYRGQLYKEFLGVYRSARKEGVLLSGKFVRRFVIALVKSWVGLGGLSE